MQPNCIHRETGNFFPANREVFFRAGNCFGEATDGLCRPLEIIESIVERIYLKLTAVARRGVDLADGEAAAEAGSRCTRALPPFRPSRQFQRRRAVRPIGSDLRRNDCALWRLEIVTRIRAIQGFVAEWEIGDDIALIAASGSGHWDPHAKVAAFDLSVVPKRHAAGFLQGIRFEPLGTWGIKFNERTPSDCTGRRHKH